MWSAKAVRLRQRMRERMRELMRQDDGTSLIELMVGMTLMVIFMGMFTGAVVMMNSAMNKSQAVNQSTSQLNVAYQTLDKTVRYATAISTPGLGAPPGDWYAELRTININTNPSTEVCTQLRLDIPTQQVQQRTWNVSSTGTSGLTNWLPIASGVSNGLASAGQSSQPFWLKVPAGNIAFQQLTFNFLSPAGSGSSLTTTASSFTFTALNSPLPAPTSPICQQQGRP